MKVSEQLIEDLLTLTRMYTYVPFNSIFLFVAYDQYRTLDFFMDEVYSKFKLSTYPKWVEDLLDNIRSELMMEETNETN